MRHERASVKADIWSYGILIWELISGKDITEYQPLAISRQSGQSPRGKLMKLPANCPAVVLKVFTECTKMEPDERPTSQDIVEWLRES
jgi:serine/threonine protein kinase